ncbi:hypothetical protein [Acidaminobacterium chupaoyuni]
MDRIFIRPLALPARVHAVTVTDENGDFNVYVNTQICSALQEDACVHELRHIRLQHFYDHEPVIINELLAH